MSNDNDRPTLSQRAAQMIVEIDERNRAGAERYQRRQEVKKAVQESQARGVIRPAAASKLTIRSRKS